MEKKLFNSGYALLIGAGGDLPTTVEDAKALRDFLTDSNRCAYPSDHVEILINSSATRARILSSLDRLNRRLISDPDATFIVYYSGHGIKVPDYYLLPYNYNYDDLSGTCISGNEFIKCLKTLKIKNLLVLLDACQAGELAKAKSLPYMTKSQIPSDLLKPLDKSGRVVIASSNKEQKSWILSGSSYSLFTQALLEALSGHGVNELDGLIRVADVAMYVSREVSRRTKNHQTPVLTWTPVENFPLGYYAGGEMSPRLIPVNELPEISPSQFRKELFDALASIDYIDDFEVRSHLLNDIPTIKKDGLKTKRHQLIRIDLRNIIDHIYRVDEIETFIQNAIDFTQSQTIKDNLEKILEKYQLIISESEEECF